MRRRRWTRPQAVTGMFVAVLVTAVVVVPGNPVTAWFAATAQTTSGVWSLVTMAASVTGLYLAGYNPRWGWWAGLPTQVVWAVAGIVLDRPGDIILSVIFTGLYGRNLWRTRGQSMARTDDLDDLRARHAVALADNAQLRAQVVALRTRLEQCPDRAEAGAR